MNLGPIQKAALYGTGVGIVGMIVTAAFRAADQVVRPPEGTRIGTYRTDDGIRALELGETHGGRFRSVDDAIQAANALGDTPHLIVQDRERGTFPRHIEADLIYDITEEQARELLAGNVSKVGDELDKHHDVKALQWRDDVYAMHIVDGNREYDVPGRYQIDDGQPTSVSDD